MLTRRLHALSLVIVVLPLFFLFESGIQMLSLRNKELMTPSLRPAIDNSTSPDSLCSLVRDVGTPSHWWTSHFDDILDASQHEQDSNYAYRNWTRSLLASLTPNMLQQGIRSRPSPHSLQHIIERVYNRIQDPSIHPPLQILVVGGSVTRGHGCNESPLLDGVPPFHPAKCAWPSRLESLMNTLAGMRLVEVYNVAVGATNLEFAMPLIQYRLYPNNVISKGGPDMIISSYATNEQASGIEDTTSSEWIVTKQKQLQEFLHICRETHPLCNATPLVMFVDDYLGNRQDFILREMSYNNIVTQLADWYNNVMHVSYADAVRRHVYAETNETTFTPPWPVDSTTHETKVAVHFGMGGHVAIAWSILYSIVDGMLAYCDYQTFVDNMKREGYEGVFPARVQDLIQNVPPPELQPDLTLKEVSHKWRNNSIRMHKDQSDCDGKKLHQSPCAFGFLAGPASTVTTPDEITNYLEPFVVKNNGWKAVGTISEDGYVKKLGLEATKANATMTLELTDIRQAMHVINVQYIKSYGNKWAGSKARFTVQVNSPDGSSDTKEFEITGHHEHQTRQVNNACVLLHTVIEGTASS